MPLLKVDICNFGGNVKLCIQKRKRGISMILFIYWFLKICYYVKES